MDVFVIIDGFLVVYALTVPFILCYFATHASETLQANDDVVYEGISWYHLPASLRKKVWMIIIQSQTPVSLNGFNIIQCTLTTFAEVSFVN